MAVVLGPFRILSASATCLSARILEMSIIAFLTALPRWSTVGCGGSDSTILG